MTSEQFKAMRVDSPLQDTNATKLAGSCGWFCLPGGGTLPPPPNYGGGHDIRKQLLFDDES